METELPKRPDYFCHVGPQWRWIVEEATIEAYTALKWKGFTALYIQQ